MNKKRYFRFLTAILSIFASLFLFFWFSNKHFEHQIIQTEAQNMAKQQTSFTNNLSLIQNIRYSTINSDNRKLLEDYQKTTQQQVAIFNRQKQMIYSSTSNESIANNNIQAIYKGAEYGYSTQTIDHRRFLTVTFPLKEKHQTIAFVQLRVPFTHFNQPIRQFSTYSATLILVLLGTILLLIFFLYRQRTQPIKTLLPTLKRIAQQPQREVQILENTPEWEELYHTVNQVGKKMNQTYRAYEQNKQQLESIVDALQVGILLINNNQQLQLMNPKGRQLLNIQTSIANQNYMELIKQRQLVQFIQQCFHEQNDIHSEITFNNLVLDIKLRYLNYDEPQVLGTIYNITELRKLEMMQADFVSNVSHELKTPITSIIGFIETLLDGAIDDKETAIQFLNIMDHDAQRLKQLIQEIIQLSRNTSEITDEDIITVSPVNVVQHLLTHYQTMIQSRHIQVDVIGNPNQTIQTLPYYFEPIIKNLIENAISYNQINGTLNIQIDKDDNQCRIIIQDTGIGIAEKDLSRIFERFYRVDKARSRNLGGTGLGLSIVQHYADLLHATVHVESQLGVGTTFTLHFPFKWDNV